MPSIGFSQLNYNVLPGPSIQSFSDQANFVTQLTSLIVIPGSLRGSSALPTMTVSSKIKVPEEFICAISLQPMVRPLMTRAGHNYERKAILEWLSKSGRCPLTREPMGPSDLLPNRQLEQRIKFWRLENGIPDPTEEELEESKCITFLAQDEMSLAALSMDRLQENRRRDRTTDSRRNRRKLLARIMNSVCQEIDDIQ